MRNGRSHQAHCTVIQIQCTIFPVLLCSSASAPDHLHTSAVRCRNVLHISASVSGRGEAVIWVEMLK